MSLMCGLRHNVASRLTKFLFKVTAFSLFLILPVRTIADSGLSVITYSQKREQSIFDVPNMTLSFSDSFIDDAFIENLSDLPMVVPGFFVVSRNSRSNSVFSLRGIGTKTLNPGVEQSVGNFIDGIYRSRSAASQMDYTDLESIEVIKGPQSALFGRNTTAGLVSIRTKLPEYKYSGRIKMRKGSGDEQNAEGYLTGTLIENTVAFRISGKWRKKEGIYENKKFLDDSLNNRNRVTLRGQLLWDIDDSSTLRIIADRSEIDEDCCAPKPLFYGPNSMVLAKTSNVDLLPSEPVIYRGIPGGLVDKSKRQTTINTPMREEADDWGVSGILDKDLSNNIKLTATAAYRETNTSNLSDSDYTQSDVLSRKTYQQFEDTSVEIRLSPQHVQNIDWQLGVYYLYQDINYKDVISAGNDARGYINELTNIAVDKTVNNLSVQNPSLPAGSNIRNLIDEISDYYQTSYFSNNNFVSLKSDYQFSSAALFGQIGWQIDRHWNVGFGLRYARESKESSYHQLSDYSYGDLSRDQIKAALQQSNNVSISQFSNATVGDNLDGGDILTGIIQKTQFYPSFNSFDVTLKEPYFSGHTSVNYTWSTNLSYYLRFSKDKKSGGLNLDYSAPLQQPGDPTVNPENVIFKPEKVASIEMGFKSHLLKKRLKIQGAVFYQEVDDFQNQNFDGSKFTLFSAEKVKGQGIEIDYGYRPTINWYLSGGFVWQRIAYEKFDSLDEGELSNLTSMFSPTFSYTGQVLYKRPLNKTLNWSLGAQYQYNSSYQTSNTKKSIFRQDGYWTANTLLSLSHVDDKFTITLWGKNITDETVSELVFPAPMQEDSYITYLNAPRSIGISGSMSF